MPDKPFLKIASHASLLVASAVTTVNLGVKCDFVRVVSQDGASAIYYTTDGTTPTVGGTHCYMIPAAIAADTSWVPSTDVNTSVKLISAGAPTVSVMGFGS